MNWTQILAVGVLVIASIYLESLWKSHAAETANTPSRRTIYDFLHTRPRALSALYFMAAACVTLWWAMPGKCGG